MELDLQVSPEEIRNREVELGCESWTSFASCCSSCSSTTVQRTLSLGLCPSTAVETAIAQCTSRWAMARGHRLNTSIVVAAVHGLSGRLFRAVSAVEPSLFRPLPPPVPVPNKPSRFRGRKAKCFFQNQARVSLTCQPDIKPHIIMTKQKRNRSPSTPQFTS